ncbi:MAG TPA: hypothetical protein VLX92_17335 [Kofleriaceae bacterium]|nr:hypothetical protein [Kofleriaceae bacterium]
MVKLVLAVALVACTSAPPGDPDPGSADPGEDLPPDSFPGGTGSDDGYVPKAFTATRFGVFYQVSADVLDAYQATDGSGLPEADGHAWLITHSSATAFASRGLADLVHRRADFYYAPAFDVWDASHAGWETASDATLQQMAHQFRDAAIAAHADLFAFNECPSNTAGDAGVRAAIAKLLRYLHEPDAQGRRLWGVVYFTERPALAASWSVPGSDLFAAIDETSVALVVEHYHSNGYVCALSESELADHYFGLRAWLARSGEPAKVSIANAKFTVLHSARFSSGPSGWAGGNADVISLADYQRALSRVAKVTRETDGGLDRISFAPVTTSLTQVGVQPRITELFRWHYLHTTPEDSELPCVAGYAGNCACN